MRPHATSLRGIPCHPMETPGMKHQSRVFLQKTQLRMKNRTRDNIGDKHGKILDEAKRDIKNEIIGRCSVGQCRACAV